METKNTLALIPSCLRLSKSHWISITALLVYFFVRFAFVQQLDQFGSYASYIFESIFVALVWVAFRKRVSFRLDFTRRLGVDIVLMLLGGFSIYKLAGLLGLGIPFDLNSAETILFLLVIAPVLEEMIFRMALWELLSEWLSWSRSLACRNCYTSWALLS